jgi:hypothetical protein
MEMETEQEEDEQEEVGSSRGGDKLNNNPES